MRDPGRTYGGASAGVYSLGAAFGAHLILNWREVPFRRVWFLFFLVVLFVDLFFYFVFPQDNIAYSGHAGGALVGVSLGLWVLENKVVHPWERRAAALGLSGFLAISALAIRGSVCH